MYYKVLNEDGSACYGGHGQWSLPHDGKPGEWMPDIVGELVLCENGYHLCREGNLLDWLGPAIYEAEAGGGIVDGDNKIACTRARLLHRLKWDERIARLFACDCAEQVLPLFEQKYPDDARPRQCIETTRRFANGEATDEELAAAGAAAGAAAKAVWAAEREWQTKRLMQYLHGEVGLRCPSRRS